MRSDFSLHNSEGLYAFRIFFKLVSVYCFVNTNQQIVIPIILDVRLVDAPAGVT